jgi:hypothetical protein
VEFGASTHLGWGEWCVRPPSAADQSPRWAGLGSGVDLRHLAVAGHQRALIEKDVHDIDDVRDVHGEEVERLTASRMEYRSCNLRQQ